MNLCEQEARSVRRKEAEERRCTGELYCLALGVSELVLRAQVGDLGHEPGPLLLC